MGLWVVESLMNIILVLVFRLDVLLVVKMMIQLVMSSGHKVERFSKAPSHFTDLVEVVQILVKTIAGIVSMLSVGVVVGSAAMKLGSRVLVLFMIF